MRADRLHRGPSFVEARHQRRAPQELCQFEQPGAANVSRTPRRARIGVHVCPGGDHDSTHSADVDYAGLLPALFAMNAGRFYLQLASEADRRRVLCRIAELIGESQRVFVGVIDPISPEVETPEQVRERVMEAASFLPLDRLGTTDDCGFSPFADDVSTARDVAFAKISARVEGTAMAATQLGM